MALLLRPLHPPCAQAPAPRRDLVALAEGGEAGPAVLVCRYEPAAPALPPSARAGGGSGGGASSLLPPPPRGPGAAADRPTVCGVVVVEAGGGRRTPAGPGPPAAWAASSPDGAGWLALARSPGSVQVLHGRTGRMFLHAPPAAGRGAAAATILGGFWLPSAPPSCQPRLALVTSAGLEVAALSARGDGCTPTASLSAPGTAWFAWNPAAGVCVLGTGTGEGRAGRRPSGGGGGRGGGGVSGGARPPSSPCWVTACVLSPGGAISRLPPCAPPELACAAGDGTPTVAVLEGGATGSVVLVATASRDPAGPATAFACPAQGAHGLLARVGSLEAPPGAAHPAHPPLFAAVDGLLLRLAPGAPAAAALDVGGGGGGGARPASLALASTPPGWGDAYDPTATAPRWSLSPAGVLLDRATGAAWGIEVDWGAAAAAFGCGGPAAAAAAEVPTATLAFYARRPGGGPGAAARTAAAYRALVVAPATRAADLRAAAALLVRGGGGGGDGSLRPPAVAALLSSLAGDVPPARLTAAAAAYVAAACGTAGAWAGVEPEAAAALDSLAVGRGSPLPPPLAAAAVCVGLTRPADPVAAALAAGAPLRALRALRAGRPTAVDAATAGAIAAAAVEVAGGAGADPVARAVAAITVNAVRAVCGDL